MKTRTTHIAHETYDGKIRCLCGELLEFGVAWYHRVHDYLKNDGGTTIFCKTCKKIYNSEQTKKNILK